jgi:hypothetical protein
MSSNASEKPPADEPELAGRSPAELCAQRLSPSARLGELSTRRYQANSSAELCSANTEWLAVVQDMVGTNQALRASASEAEIRGLVSALQPSSDVAT